jgi:hypothetical protein
MGALAVLLGSILVAGSVTFAAQTPPPNSVGNQAENSIRGTDCRALVRCTDMNSAAYKPGLDTDVSPVAGANVSDTGVSIVLAEITFTLTLCLADFIPHIAAGLAGSAAPIGEITVRGQEVFLNGHTLNELQTKGLDEQCRTNLDSCTEE